MMTREASMDHRCAPVIPQRIAGIQQGMTMQRRYSTLAKDSPNLTARVRFPVFLSVTMSRRLFTVRSPVENSPGAGAGKDHR